MKVYLCLINILFLNVFRHRHRHYPTFIFFSCVFCSYVSPLYVFGVVSLDVEPYHVQIVERHLMAVSAEDVHVVVLVDIRRVSVTGGRPSANHAKLGLAHGGIAGGCKVACLSALAHLLVVGIESVVGVLDDERLLHRD